MDLTGLLAMPFDGIGTILTYLVPFLVVMTVIVFFHELGHFLVARWCGVKVEAFSIGFGREIVGWYDRHGTRWKIAWIPLGGYVRFKGDADAASRPDHDSPAAADPDSFPAKPLWQRALIVAAGPLANFILAIVLFAGYYMAVGVTVLEPVVSRVLPDSPAAEAGLQPGDRIVAIEGEPVDSFARLREIVGVRAGEPLRFTIQRGERTFEVTITPRLKEVPDGFGGRMKVGVIGVVHEVSPASQRHVRVGPVEAVGLAVRQTWSIITGTLTYLKGMIFGQQSTEQLAGPIRIAQVTSSVASVTILGLIPLAAVLSVSIGLINLFPIPMLDGGHLLYYAIEAVRGRPLSESAQEFGFKVGMMLVLSLMLLATFNDLRHLFFD